MTNNNPSQQEMIEEIYKKIAERNIKKINDQIAKITCKPVMFGDVIDFIEKNGFTDGFEKKYGIETAPIGQATLPIYILSSWKDKRKPIEEQSDDCIEYVYDLIFE